MDCRQALREGDCLPFPGMRCVITREIGRGSNAIVYQASYMDELNKSKRHSALIKELFPLHDKGAIYRDAEGRIIVEADGKETWERHKRSFEYGNEIHLSLKDEFPEIIVENWYTLRYHETFYTMLNYTGGRSLGQELAISGQNLRALVVRTLKLLSALKAFHGAGYLHLDIAPDNILLIGAGEDERVTLIDYNSVHPRSTVRDEKPSAFSRKEGYSAPEIIKHRIDEIDCATDLYSVAAVFYRALFGAPLGASQRVLNSAPDVSQSALLRDAPEIVKDMASQILDIGLSLFPEDRYQSAEEMSLDMRELLDRIDGVGVTHGSLWESGKRNVLNMIQSNPSFSYLLDEDALFPSNLALADGSVLPLRDCLAEALSPDGSHMLISAPGGMGKTTALLSAALLLTDFYDPDFTAAAYVPLNAYHEGSPSYILDRILERLRFRPETRDFETARHTLQRLLDEPLISPDGEIPVLLLLLDGLNEVSAPKEGLLREIEELSRKRGVRLILTTRSEEDALDFPRFRLTGLTDEDIRRSLARARLLMPESPEICQLLQTPLMLSLFVRSAEMSEQQVPVKTKEELLRFYFNALQEKAVQDYPDEEWQIKAALSFILPTIASEARRNHGVVSNEKLMSTVEGRYRLLPPAEKRVIFSRGFFRRGQLFLKLFPEWSGRSEAVKGGVANSDEWYGRIVHDLLWKRLGLLARTESGGYQFPHEIILNYQADIGQTLERKIALWRSQRGTCLAALLLLFVLLWSVFTRPPQYDRDAAESVISLGAYAYNALDLQHEHIQKLVEAALESPEEYERELDDYENIRRDESLNSATLSALNACNLMLGIDDEEDDALEETPRFPPPSDSHGIAALFHKETVVPWSQKTFDAKHYRELATLEEELTLEYRSFADMLTFVMRDSKANGRYANGKKENNYVLLLSNLIAQDAKIAANLYEISCCPHIAGPLADDSAKARNISGLISPAVRLNRELTSETDLNRLRQILESNRMERRYYLLEIQQCGVTYDYQRVTGGAL